MTRTINARPEAPAASRRAPESRAAPARLHPTKNDLPEASRREAAALLNQRLADCIDLQTQCKQAHWNVKGPGFIALHKLFDDVNEDVEEYVDLLAERVVQLGGTAEGTARMVAERSTLSEYPGGIVSDGEHVAALSDALAAFGRAVRECIRETERLEDAASTDILTEITRRNDKWLWFVEAHLEGGSARH